MYYWVQSVLGTVREAAAFQEQVGQVGTFASPHIRAQRARFQHQLDGFFAKIRPEKIPESLRLVNDQGALVGANAKDWIPALEHWLARVCEDSL